MKNYRGKLKGIKRANLIEKKRDEEKTLQNFIESNLELKARYRNVLEKIGNIFDQRRQQAAQELLLYYLRRSVDMVYFGYTAYEASLELQKKDLERESDYMDRNFPLTKEKLRLTLKNYYQSTDKVILKEMMMRASRLPKNQRIAAIDHIIEDEDPEGAIDVFIKKAYKETRLDDPQFLMEALTKSPQELKELEDPFIEFSKALYPTYQKLKEIQKARKGALDELYAKLIDIRKKFLKKDFIPDANRTLRLTYGRIRGYRPADAVSYRPITTGEGVIEKTSGTQPFDTPSELLDLLKVKDFGRFEHPRLKSVPVCILYDTDTTSGNSGSPVLNARGELVGINFDRTYEATINDFAWSEDYSRSIAVDIRYVLWVTQKFGGVDYLLKEMDVNSQ